MADMQAVRMTIEEIEARYPSHWILIDEPEMNEVMQVVSGVVVAAGDDCDGLWAKAGGYQPKRSALHCTRKMPKDLRFLPWPFRLTSTTPSSR